MRFQEAIETGTRYERAVAQWMSRRGWHIVGMACAGWQPRRAPIPPEADYTYPDMLIERKGYYLWLDVKSKERADWYRIGAYAVTGFPLRHWTRYWHVQQTTGIEVAVLFLHRHDNEARAASLAALERAISHTSDKMGGMIFFKVVQIKQVGTYKEVTCE